MMNWENEDLVSIFPGITVNNQYKVSGITDGKASFAFVDYVEPVDGKYDKTTDKYNYAVYPYADANSITADGTITTETPTEFAYDGMENSIRTALMAAKSVNGSLSFKNVQGILRLRLNAKQPLNYGAVKSIKIESATHSLSGAVTITFNEEGLPVATLAADGGKTLTLNLSSELQKSLPKADGGGYDEFYIPMVPASFEANDVKMTIDWLDDEKVDYEKVVTISFNIERRKIYTLRHTIGADDYDGTIEDEVVSDEVANEAQLKKALQANINQPVTITLLNNIELTEPWTPIGNKENDEYFMGTLDGNGYTISGLNVAANDYDALISAAKDATIKNLTVEGTVNGVNAAGIVARAEGATVIENCVSNVAVSGTTKAGGIVSNVTNTGDGKQTIIKNCVNSAAVSCSKDKLGGVGGMIGYVNTDADVQVIDCINNGSVTGTDDQTTGAVIGNAAANSKGMIENFKNTGTVSGKNYKGDKLGRWIETGDGTIFAGYCGTPANWYVKSYDTNGNTYILKEGKLTLARISETYTESSLVVPIGVDALGNKVLNGNTTIKEVTIPSGLTDFGGTPNTEGTGASGGFFYKSAVEKITLPEGLTEIPAAAFNQASNLKEVNIPSTVTTIGINAFAGSGLTELKVPSTVTNIGYGAFRDMANLTTVTIEGDNVNIPNYAFRACANLQSIYLKVNTLTLGDNMIFTNTSTNNENPNDITIFVYNDDVYNTLINNSNVKCKIVKVTSVSSSTDLSSALSNGGSVELADGNYALPGINNGSANIFGTKDVVITIDKPNYSGSDVTLNGVTVKGSGYATGIQHVNTVTYNDVTIQGEMCLYGEKVVFNNCSFELNGQYIWTYGAKEVEFNNCIFNTTGKAILIYNEGAGASKVTVKGCTFNATAGAKAGAIANQNCAAIEIDNFQSSGTGAAHVLITEGNTYSNNFSGQWRIKNYVAGNVVTVNEVGYNSIAIDGKTMTIDANKNVTVNE